MASRLWLLEMDGCRRLGLIHLPTGTRAGCFCPGVKVHELSEPMINPREVVGCPQLSRRYPDQLYIMSMEEKIEPDWEDGTGDGDFSGRSDIESRHAKNAIINKRDHQNE